jgi:predicted dehydrogenase
MAPVARVILHRGAFPDGRGEQKGREEPTKHGFSQYLEGALKMTKIQIGLVGLGEVAQIIHLPILQNYEDTFEIAAICDLSQELLSALGERYHVPAERRYLDAEALAKKGDLDAIFVLNSDEFHTDAALAALEHGKHVFIEKPMCLTRQEAEAIIKARDEAGVQVMVGYMRRYAPAFVQAVEHVRALEKINYARVRDIIGQNAQFIGQSSVVLRPKDISAEAMQDRTERASRLVKTAIGDAPQNLVSSYRLLCGSSSHDLSAMRELLGMPRRVIAARQWGSFLTVLFAYEKGFTVTFETGIDHNRRFDAHLQVYGEAKDIRVQYNTPYIRHLPTLLFVNETHGEAFEEQVIRPSFTDAYTMELLHFYEVVTQNAQPKTSAEDFLYDLDLFEMIINALRE